MYPLGTAKIGSFNLLVYVGSMAKTDIGPMNVEQTRQLDTIEKLLGGPLTGPLSNMIWSFPVTVENMSHQ